MNAEAANEIKLKTDSSPVRAWFCVRCQKKREMVAAADLHALGGVEVFNPFVRFRRSTLRGPAWVSEAMFPSYLFARFELTALLAGVRHARGVSGLVRFGERYPAIPDHTIAEMRRFFGENATVEVPLRREAGEQVELAGGLFHGLEAVVLRVMPAQERIRLLMDFMGCQAMVDVAVERVVPVDGRVVRVGY